MAAEGCIRAQTAAFARATGRYWLDVFPQARRELLTWRRRAEAIPDRVLRAAARSALLTKDAELDGAAAFAVLADPTNRESVVRALTTFQLTFDYLDAVAELPSPDPIANGRSLSRALLAAVFADVPHSNYYACQPDRDDAGYLDALIQSCRAAIARLPRREAIAVPAQRLLARTVTYQSLGHGDSEGSYRAFVDWARGQDSRGADLAWWELAAAGGSQLPVLALLAAAGNPHTSTACAEALERAYFPWVGALSTLLDSVVDREIDASEGRHSLLDHYECPQQAVERLRLMAIEAKRAIGQLADAESHAAILAGMAAFFHSCPRASEPQVAAATRAVVRAVGPWTVPALIVYRMRCVGVRDRSGEVNHN